MKFLLCTAALVCTLPAVAQTGDSAKYARCAGSTEMQKCRDLVDAVAAETPEAKKARAAKLERERSAAAEQVAKSPSTARAVAYQSVRSEPRIGMTEDEAAQSSWGRPESANRTVTKHGAREQWVYGAGRYLYLENGRVTAITSSR